MHNCITIKNIFTFKQTFKQVGILPFGYDYATYLQEGYFIKWKELMF